MKKPLVVATCLSVLTAACSHTVRHVAPLPPQPADAELTATVRTPGGDSREQPVQPPDGGATTLRTLDGQPIDASTIADVTVTTRDRGRGALEGGLIGLGVGGVTGMITGLVIGSKSTCDEGDLSCPVVDGLLDVGLMFEATLAGLLIGTVTGGLLGAAFGHDRRDVYEASVVPQVGVAPTAGGAQASAAWRF